MKKFIIVILSWIALVLSIESCTTLRPTNLYGGPMPRVYVAPPMRNFVPTPHYKNHCKPKYRNRNIINPKYSKITWI
jgi:hypothetical protein